MMDVPAKIMERRAELERAIEALQDSIRLHESDMAAQGAFAARLVAQLGDIDLCIAAIEDSAKVPNADAVEVVTADGYVLAAEVGSSPAGSAEALNGIEPKKPRAPKRDIRGLVLDTIHGWSSPPSMYELVRDKALHGVSKATVESAVAYWQAKGRLTLDGGVVRLWDTGRLDDRNSGETEVNPSEIGGRPLTHNEPVEIIGQGKDVAEDGITYGIGGLIAFLQAEPDSTMAEINDAGIPASEVYRAEKEGIVFAKAHGLYALVEPQQSEAAE